MDFMIMDSGGNAVESFSAEQEALQALLGMAQTDPSAALHLAVLAFDDEGETVGEPLTVADVRPEAASTLVMFGDQWLQRDTLTVLCTRWASVMPNRFAGAL